MVIGSLRTLRSLGGGVALVMVMLVVVSASGLGNLRYLCSMTGQVGRVCCCQDAAEAAVEDGLVWSGARCCEVVSVGTDLLPGLVVIVSGELERPRVVLLPQVRDTGSFTRVPVALASLHAPRAPPPDTGSRLFVELCSYLI